MNNKRKIFCTFLTLKTSVLQKTHQNIRKCLKNHMAYQRPIRMHKELWKFNRKKTAHYITWRAWADTLHWRYTHRYHIKRFSAGRWVKTLPNLSWHSHGERRGPTPVSCSLTSTCMLWHTPTSPEVNKCLKKLASISDIQAPERSQFLPTRIARTKTKNSNCC